MIATMFLVGLTTCESMVWCSMSAMWVLFLSVAMVVGLVVVGGLLMRLLIVVCSMLFLLSDGSTWVM